MKISVQQAASQCRVTTQTIRDRILIGTIIADKVTDNSLNGWHWEIDVAKSKKGLVGVQKSGRKPVLSK